MVSLFSFRLFHTFHGSYNYYGNNRGNRAYDGQPSNNDYLNYEYQSYTDEWDPIDSYIEPEAEGGKSYGSFKRSGGKALRNGYYNYDYGWQPYWWNFRQYLLL